MAPIVFAFEGTRRFGHPGWVETAERVQQDFGEWRRTTSTDGKSIAKWLIAHGYRVLNYAGRANDGSTYRSWWGLVSVFGEPNNEHGPIPVEEIREKVKQQQRAPTNESVSAAVTQMYAVIAKGRRDMMASIANENPGLSPREINEEMKARIEMGCYD